MTLKLGRHSDEWVYKWAKRGCLRNGIDNIETMQVKIKRVKNVFNKLIFNRLVNNIMTTVKYT